MKRHDIFYVLIHYILRTVLYLPISAEAIDISIVLFNTFWVSDAAESPEAPESPEADDEADKVEAAAEADDEEVEAAAEADEEEVEVDAEADDEDDEVEVGAEADDEDVFLLDWLKDSYLIKEMETNNFILLSHK